MTDPTQMIKVRLRVEGMDCASYATKIETALVRVPGVTDAAASVTGGTATVSHDGTFLEAKIRNPILALGYAIATKGYSGALLIATGTAKETVTLAASGENSLQGEAMTVIAPGDGGAPDQDRRGQVRQRNIQEVAVRSPQWTGGACVTELKAMSE